MKIDEYLNSGIIEMYVMGALPPEEANEVTTFASKHPELLAEIEEVRLALESYVLTNSKPPGKTLKPLLFATLDYFQRMEKGEIQQVIPPLSKTTTKEDFSDWLQRPDMQLPENFNEIHIKLIGYTPTSSTAIVWLKNQSPEEIHHYEIESFFILEGSCNVLMNNDVYQLYPGDQFTVPLHVRHTVQVTSAVPCKLILQRKAA